MKKYSLHIILLSALFFFQFCTASKYSNKTKNEHVAIKVDENGNAINYALFQQQSIPTLASRSDNTRASAMVGKAVSYAIKGAVMAINMEKKKYTASYKQELNDLYFYDQLSTESVFDPVGMQFKGFTLVRTIKTKSGTIDTAICANFILDTDNPYEIINNSFFMLKLADIKLNYSKAKVESSSWYMPSFLLKNPDKLNIDFEITIRSSWVTPDGVFNNNVVIGQFFLSLRNIPMDRNSVKYSEYFENLKNTPLIGKSSLVPRSYGYYYFNTDQLKKCYGQGLYTINIDVKESGAMNFVLKTISENTVYISR